MRAAVLFALGAVGAATDDASALVQSQVLRHRSGAVELEGLQGAFAGASDTFSQKLLDLFARMPMPARPSAEAAGGVRIKRTGYVHEEGSSMTFHSTGGCTNEDAGGSNDCTINWGTTVNMSFAAHLKGGLKRGDKVSFNVAARVQVMNKSHPLAGLMTGTAVGTGGSCDICEGTCFSSTAADEGAFVLDVTSPSAVANESFCASLAGAHPAVDLALPAFPVNLMAPPEELQLSGEFLVSMEILDRSGKARVSQTIEHTILPGAPAANAKLNARPLLPKTLAAALETSLRKVTPAMLSQGRKSETVEAYRKLAPKAKKLGKKINALLFKLRVADVEAGSGRNVSLTTDAGCKPLDQQGSTDCKFEFAKPTNVTVGLHVAYTSEAGSYAIVKSTPKVGGMLGMMLGAMLKPTTMRVPLCGKATVTVAAGMKPVDMDAGPCGFHAINLRAPAFPLLLPDLSEMSLKFEGLPPVLPPTFGDLPPTTVETDVKMFHADGRTIASFATTAGIGYA